MIRSCSKMPGTDAFQASPLPAAQPPNNHKPRNPPATPVKNGCRWKKLSGLDADGCSAGALWAGEDSAGVEPGERAVSGESGGTLRRGGACCFPWVWDPPLPMLDECLRAELPARVSAIAGASARVAQKKTDKRKRQSSSRNDMGFSLERLRGAAALALAPDRRP
jgi:hypothetical protein